MKNKREEWPYGYKEEEIFKDEDEKKEIMEKPEIEKEKIIFERIEALNLEKEKSQLYNKADNQENKSAVKKKSSDALDESDSESESGEVHNDDGDYESNKSRRKNSDISGGTDSVFTDEEMNPPKKEIKYNITENEINKIRLARKFFEKYYEIPIFDENIKGAFVKINISTNAGTSKYILGTIKEIIIKQDKQYKFGNHKINKYVNVSHANKDKVFNFNYLSNSEATENEVNTWKTHMENHKLPLPTEENIKQISDNIKKVSDYCYSNAEINEMLNKKKETKIKNNDKNINITSELDALNEKYNSLIEKYNESHEDKYLLESQKTKKAIHSLEKMNKERELKEIERSKQDVVVQINERKLEKQRQDDIKYSLLQKKKQRENKNTILSQYTRKNCNPKNLFDIGYIKSIAEKDEKEEKKKTDEANRIIEEEEKKLKNIFIREKEHNTISHGVKIYKQMKNIQKQIIEKGDELDKMIKEEEEVNKSDNTKNNPIDMSLFFKLANINYDTFYKNINLQNEKYRKDPKIKIITLDEI